ncbi:MAG: hypothetical protein WC670_19345, partial [Pseudolabrys sp.]
DLTTQIADAINDAIAAYSSERFRFSDTPLDAPSTFYTVAAQAVYTSADLAALATMYKIDFVNMNVGTASVFGLSPDTAESLLLYNQQSGFMRGQPSWYAYRDNQLILAAVPDQAYLITVGMFLNKAAPASDAETGNPWMTDAERLIRARAKFEIATHVTRNDKMAMMMSPSPPAENQGMVGAAYREWKVLKGVANRVSSRGKVRPMAF